MGAESIYSNAESAQMAATVLRETLEDVVRLKNETTRVLDRIIKLEDGMRMLINMSDRIGKTTREDGPEDGKTKDHI